MAGKNSGGIFNKDGTQSDRMRRPGGGETFGNLGKTKGAGTFNRTVAAPPSTNPQGVLTPRDVTSGGTPGGGGPGGGVGGISAAEATARRSGKERSAKENAASQAIIDALLGSLVGYEKGRDQQLANADNVLNQSLEGILNSLRLATQDYEESGKANEMDQASKTAANVTNRARERVSLLQQAASQGAGETDQLRSQIQAFLNSDANQQETERSFFDTERSINAQIAGANSQAETSRRSAWNSNQEAKASAWAEFWKNRGDVFTNIQRTQAQNTNVDDDYTEGFSARLGGYDPVKEAADAAGRTYEVQKQDDEFFRRGRADLRNKRSTSTTQAGATKITAPKAAEGATLRGRNW
ncbi:hypothetical protein SEA_ALOEVERA_44 [Microbacterium phage AloeVera]|uniref:Uncharacterized protein n=1 Tax=Microbacterium phage Ashton TaxID=2562366 RepID=A0A6M3T0H6_9CAUD|nr:hypothetical protein SEA_ASHTON_44 [Microbacterium phage Ashton]